MKMPALVSPVVAPLGNVEQLVAVVGPLRRRSASALQVRPRCATLKPRDQGSKWKRSDSGENRGSTNSAASDAITASKPRDKASKWKRSDSSENKGSTNGAASDAITPSKPRDQASRQKHLDSSENKGSTNGAASGAVTASKP